MLSSDPGLLIIITKVRGDMYKTTKGLVGSHGPAWQEVRSFVQVDMMRPRSAVFYIDTVDTSSLQLCDLLQQKRSPAFIKSS